MNLRKYFMRTQPANKEPFSEEVGLFEDAVKAILDGSEPWQIDALRSTIALGTFNPDEQRHLQDFVDNHITEKRKEIMRVALTKVLTGNGLEKGLANKVATLGKQEEHIKQGIISSAMKEKMEWHQEEMRKKMQEYQNSTIFYNDSNVGNAVQQRIENPFSSK